MPSSARLNGDPMNKKKLILSWILAFLPGVLAVALYLIAPRSKAFSEWYAEKIYPLWVGSMGRLTGIFPFSVNEIAIYILILLGFFWLIRDIVRIIRRREKKGWLSRWLRTTAAVAGCLGLMFMIGCGINYNGRTFAQKYNMDISGGSKEELAEIVRLMVREVNALADQVPRDADGLCIMEDTLLDDATAAMRNLASDYQGLDGYYPHAKPVLWSRYLSMENITGVHSPFTSEAQYNNDVIPYGIPHTICHELSHLKGFMREDEANFVGFLACIRSERPVFRYSGYLLGYIYAGNALYGADLDLWREATAGLDAAAIYDLTKNTEYWGRYKTKLAEIKEASNDTYLKINHQEDGVKSYGRVVDLMIGYYRQQTP